MVRDYNAQVEPPDGDKMTYTQAAARFGMSADTVARWVREGRITKFKRPVDRRVYVSVAEISDIVNQEPTPAA